MALKRETATMTTSKPEESVFNPEQLFKQAYDRAVDSGLTRTDLATLSALSDLKAKPDHAKAAAVALSCSLTALKYLLLFLALVNGAWFLDWPVEKTKVVKLWLRAAGVHKADVDVHKCLVRAPDRLMDVFRPPTDCGFCRNVSQVQRLQDVVPERFEEVYAYSGRPAVIVDGMHNWSALESFSFKFFQDLYSPGSKALESVRSSCQFFPYKTEFRHLGDVFSMTPDRAYMKEGAKPWYIGWSNCDATAGNVLRQHYRRPYFLPRDSESSKTDWIFMGSPGYGAHMHVDNVHLPSWQAQVTGTKRWTLEPPPECFLYCPPYLHVDVHPGEIIVLDTNKWFHSTLNIGSDISITIGSEFD